MEEPEQPTVKAKLIDAVTLGLIESLENYPSVCDVNVKINKPVSKTDLASWEQTYICILPPDLKSFYLTCDGLTINWKYKICRKKKLPLGHLNINSLNDLIKIGPVNQNTNDSITIIDTECDDEKEDSKFPTPTFKSNCKIFQLDQLEDKSRVCLVYHLAKDGSQELKNPKIWYLDNALTWTFLAKGFISYYRLLLAHMGLPLWQKLMTTTGLPIHTQKWYQTFAPTRFLQTENSYQAGFVVETSELNFRN